VLRDQHRRSALRWHAWLEDQGRLRLTTGFVLWELLNGLAVPPARASAIEVYRRCQVDGTIELVPFESGQVESALQLYQTRKDKSWSLTDCHSFIVMRERGLTEALTTDRHFLQAGFRALLLEDLPTDL
jgi:predicted nucleic acid-binding protein